VQWLLELLGVHSADPNSIGAALEAIMSAPRSAEPLLFLPYLQGERVPYWAPNLRGAWIGLSRNIVRSTSPGRCSKASPF
jgi:xylulokinase